jgi:hypothetical protein
LRVVVLTVALLFIALLAALTIIDLVRNGITALDVLAILILVMFATGIVGALRRPPSE